MKDYFVEFVLKNKKLLAWILAGALSVAAAKLGVDMIDVQKEICTTEVNGK